MLILRPGLSDLVACEVREIPLTLRSTECIQPARLHNCLFLYSEKCPRPSDRGHTCLRLLSLKRLRKCEGQMSLQLQISSSDPPGVAFQPKLSKVLPAPPLTPPSF